MKLILRFILVVAMAAGLGRCAIVRADDAIDQATANAALGRAVDSLYGSIAQLRLTDRVSVGDMLARANAQVDLLRALQSAEQIGGPRMNGIVCELQLQIQRQRVVDVLKQIIATRYENGWPITPELVDSVSARWPDRFSATGTAISASQLDRIQPGAGNKAWSTIGDDARKAALAAARDDAASKAMAMLHDLPLRNSTLGAALDAGKSADVLAWLSNRPIVGVSFSDSTPAVDLTFYVNASELMGVVRTAVAQQNRVAVPPDNSGEWGQMENAVRLWLLRAGGMVGHATAEAPAAQAGGVAVPHDPPAWVNTQLTVDGTASGGDNQLKVARKAEADGRAKLRQMVENLPLTKDQTIGQAAAHDSRIADAITRSVAGAKVTHTAYGPNQSATVTLMLDLHDLWNALPH